MSVYLVSFRLTERKGALLGLKAIKDLVKETLAGDINYDAKVSNIVVLPVSDAR